MTSEPADDTPRKPGTRRWLLPAAFFVVGALITAGIFALLMNIMQRKQEGSQANFQVVQLTEKSFDPAEWGKNFPAQYEGWKATATNQGEVTPRVPATTVGDGMVTASKLKADPRLVTMWQGYAFAVEYNEPRGHAHMLDDQRLVKRVQAPFKQPGACLNCHSSVPEVLANIGGDPATAWATMNKTPYADASKWANHPVTCIDCHDPETMALRITRPALIEGLKELKAGQGIKDWDISKATNNEMRAYVCAQCHVEYYFAGDAKTLTFPWDKGLTANNALDYYDEVGFSDFTQSLTGAKVLKAQHPDYETWAQGIHAQNGVTCADCHMPYMRQGAVKVSDHQIASPLSSEAQINRTCLTCHRATAAEMKSRVETIQGRWKASQSVSFDALSQLIRDINEAKQAGTTNPEWITAAQQWQRKAQYFQDYTVSENSRGFHAPQYALTLVNEVTDAARRGQLALRGVTLPITTDPTQYTPMIATPAPTTATTAPATPAPTTAAPATTAAPTPIRPAYSPTP
jgi:nitrite reductase (cytochrome c-552)